jgi:hypothetical protein
MRRILDTLLSRNSRRPIYKPKAMTRVPDLPIGFVPRTDPNFYFLSRKF